MARLVVSWSGGKDACLALSEALRAGHRVVGLLATVSEPPGRVTMHGVRRELVHAQARALGLPLWEALLPAGKAASETCPVCPLDAPQPGLVPNTTYERVTLAALEPLAASGVEGVVFGDIYLEDLRRFRQQLLAHLGLDAHFPLWGRAPEEVLAGFTARRGKALVVCARADLAQLLGCPIHNGFREKLPADVDPCGEKGEFHTFAYDFELFPQPLTVRTGETVESNGFRFLDLALV